MIYHQQFLNIAFRKYKEKNERAKEKLVDHHLFQSVTDVSTVVAPKPERPGDIPPLNLARELTEVSTRDIIKPATAIRTHRRGEGNHHRNMNALKDPEGRKPLFI